MGRTDSSDRICGECWERAIYAYGTGAIFLARSQRYRNLLRALAFVGIAVPLLVGGFVIGFGVQSPHLPELFAGAAALGLFLLGFSAWSIVYGWADNLEYSLESVSDNFDLAEKFKELGRLADDPPADLDGRFGICKVLDDARRRADAKKAVTAKELRYGHRAGLRQFRRSCDGCKQVPQSMEATDCPVCGRF